MVAGVAAELGSLAEDRAVVNAVARGSVLSVRRIEDAGEGRLAGELELGAGVQAVELTVERVAGHVVDALAGEGRIAAKIGFEAGPGRNDQSGLARHGEISGHIEPGFAVDENGLISRKRDAGQQ